MEIESHPLLAGRLRRATLPCQIKIAYFVIRRRAIPHPALRIAEKFAHGKLRMREWIFKHLPRFWIEAPNYIHIMGIVPKITVSIETQRIRTGIPAWQWKFLEGLRLGVELQHLAAAKFAGIDHAVGPNFHPSRVCIRRWRGPLCDFHGFRFDLANFV